VLLSYINLAVGSFDFTSLHRHLVKDIMANQAPQKGTLKADDRWSGCGLKDGWDSEDALDQG
jgi:hypothetical protein